VSVIGGQGEFSPVLEQALEVENIDECGAVVWLGDGAVCNWRLADHLAADAQQILDWHHAVEHAVDCGKVLLGEDSPWPRNRRLAEAFGKCGLVERSGQGADLLFETAVREGKTPLDYRGSDAFQVRLTLHGEVEDEGFLRYLEQATRDAGRSSSVEELRVLDAIRREQPTPGVEASSVRVLVDLGLIGARGPWPLAPAGAIRILRFFRGLLFCLIRGDRTHHGKVLPRVF
jgi:hypothetical protein